MQTETVSKFGFEPWERHDKVRIFILIYKLEDLLGADGNRLSVTDSSLSLNRDNAE